MIIRKILNFGLSFFLTLQAMVFQVALPDVVLCFGDDGHIAFELQGKTNQCDHDDVVSNFIPYLSDEETNEIAGIDCTDIKLHFHTSFANKISKKNFTIFTNITYERLDIWKVNENPTDPSLITPESFPHHPIKEILQSTILII